MEYGYKEHTVTDRGPEAPAERHVVTKEVKTVYVPPEKHISAPEKQEVHISKEVRFFFLHYILFQILCPSEICFSLKNSITFNNFFHYFV